MPILRDILINVTPVSKTGDMDADVSSLCIDSRKVTAGSAFIAVRGTLSDGHDYIDKAIEVGASVIVCESLPVKKESIAYIQVKDSAAAAGLIADAFYDFPSKELKVIGITGTNGKTTTATLLYKLFEGLGHKCGLLSTVQNYIHKDIEEATHTTPDAISIHA